jgi:hypothetical protein
MAAPTATPLSAETQSLLNRTPAPVATQQTAQPAKAPEVGTMADFLDTPIQTASEAAPAEPKGLLSVAKGGVQKFLNQDTIKGNLAAAADVVTGLPSAVSGLVGYGAGRAFGLSPDEATAASQKVAAPLAQVPGKLMGQTETATYKNAVPTRIMDAVSQFIGERSDVISQKTGIPVQDVEAAINALSIAVPVGLAKGYKVANAKFGKDLEVVRPGQLSKAEAQAQFEAKQAQQGTAVGAAQAESLGTAKPTTPETPYTELSYSEKGLPLDEQSARSQTISRVLGADHKVDLSAIEGKGKERATNYAVSNTDTPMGNYLKENFNSEQKGLTKYGEGLVKKSGGTLGLDEATLYKRGNTQLAPFEEYGNLLDTEIGKLYAERNKTAKEVPIQANFTKDLLNDDSVIQLADNEKLAKATKAKMNQLGIMDKDGNLLNTDAFKAEQLRKWLNSSNVWSPQNAGLHRLLKESIDNDVFAHADKAVYADARALFGLRKDTLDNPKGIATILDESGPSGINRKVDVEKVANKIAGMGVDQFTHIIDTLDKMPAALQPKAIKAKAEIKAQFLNQAIAQKSPAKLTTYMNENKEVMNRLFTPDEMAEIRDYHNASHILATDTGYKGSAVQKINVEQKLLPKIAGQLLQKGAALGAEAVTGGSTFGTAAMLTNEYLGQKAAKKQAKLQTQAEQKAFENTQKRFVPIKDLINKEQK